MKTYLIDVDITFSRRVEVTASSEEEARTIFEQKMKNNPYDYIRGGYYVDHEITEVEEEEE